MSIIRTQLQLYYWSRGKKSLHPVWQELQCFLSKRKIQGCPSFVLSSQLNTSLLLTRRSVLASELKTTPSSTYSCFQYEWTSGMLSGSLFIISSSPHLIFILLENVIRLLFTIPTNEEASQCKVNINPAATLPGWPPHRHLAALTISDCFTESWRLYELFLLSFKWKWAFKDGEHM